VRDTTQYMLGGLRNLLYDLTTIGVIVYLTDVLDSLFGVLFYSRVYKEYTKIVKWP
jgi:phage-related holin